MKNLSITRPHRLSKLSDELLAAVPSLRPVAGVDGVNVARAVVSGDGRILQLQLPDDADEQAIRAVVDAHDATTPGTAEVAVTLAAGNETTVRDRLEQALNNWATLTAAQKDAVLKGLVRLALRRLDSAG
jgi:hypothetical protein